MYLFLIFNYDFFPIAFILNQSRPKPHILTGFGIVTPPPRRAHSISPDDTWQVLVKVFWLCCLLVLALTSPGWNSHLSGTYAVCWNAWGLAFSFFFSSSGFQATRLFQPSECGWSNSHESFYHLHQAACSTPLTRLLRGCVCFIPVQRCRCDWSHLPPCWRGLTRTYSLNVFLKLTVWSMCSFVALNCCVEVPWKVLVCVGGPLRQSNAIVHLCLFWNEKIV